MPDLSPEQKSAVRYISGPLLVLAGAGSGKTSLLIHKIAWLIREYGVAPPEIAALGASPAAARALGLRLAEIIPGAGAREVLITTLAGLGMELLETHAGRLGYRPGYSIYGPKECRAVLARLALSERLEHPVSAAEVHAFIARAKRTGELPAPRSPAEAAAAQLFEHYERALMAANALDLEDLIAKPLRVLNGLPETESWRQPPLRHLLIDGLEEATPAQQALVSRLAGLGAQVTAVIDTDSAFPAGLEPWLERLRGSLPGARVVRLEQNFRSSGRILKAANTLIAHNRQATERRLWSEAAYGEPIRVYRARSEEHEAERVVGALLEHKSRSAADFRHYAILVRRSDQIRPFRRALRERRIPYYEQGADSLFEQTEVRDLVACLRFLCNPTDDEAFLRIISTPRRDLDRSTLEVLERHARTLGTSLLQAALDPRLGAQVPPPQLASLRGFAAWLRGLAERAVADEPITLTEQMLAELRYAEWLRDTCNDRKIAEERMENIAQLIGMLRRLSRQEPGARLPRLVAQLRRLVALGFAPDDWSGDAVTLTTLAQAKGAEYQHVYVAGLEEGLLPAGDNADEASIETERFLFYLGITRARATLALSLSERRRRGGEILASRPSRFLAEIPTGDLDWAADDGLLPIAAAQPAPLLASRPLRST